MGTVTELPTKKAAKRARKATAKQATADDFRLTIVTQVKQDTTIHWYELNGKSLSGRGVTTVLGAGLAAPALAKWGRNTVANCALDERDVWGPLDRNTAYEYLRNSPDRDRDAAGNRGRDVHELAEALNRGEEVVVPEELENHVDAYLDFLRDWEPEIVAFEVVGYNHKFRYAGKFDLLIRVKGWWPDRPDEYALVLVDIKTARSGVFPKDALQLVAYGAFDVAGTPEPRPAKRNQSPNRSYEDLVNPPPMPKVDGYAVLHLSAERVYKLVPVKPERVPKLFATFIHCLRIAEFTGGEYLDRSKWAEDKGWQEDVFDRQLQPYETF
jgi:hypothetical protein